MNIAGGTPITATFEYDILLILKGACKNVSFKSPCRDISLRLAAARSGRSRLPAPPYGDRSRQARSERPAERQ